MASEREEIIKEFIFIFILSFKMHFSSESSDDAKGCVEQPSPPTVITVSFPSTHSILVFALIYPSKSMLL